MCRGTLRIRSSTSGFAIPCSRNRCTSRSRVRAEVMPMPLRRRSTIDAFQPLRHELERAVPGEIDLQRRHRDEPLRYGVEVRPRPGILLRSSGSDPVDLAAPRIARGYDALRAVPEA